jgi:hypothetical protein
VELQRWDFQGHIRTVKDSDGLVKHCAVTCSTVTVPGMDGLDRVIAQNFRGHLEQQGLRREEFASGMTRLGFPWSGNRVTQVTTGRRPLTLLELAGVCSLLRVHLAELIGTEGSVDLPHGPTVPASALWPALLGEQSWMADAVTATPVPGLAVSGHYDEATVKAARRLHMTPSQVHSLATMLWQRSVTEERDRRVGPPGDDEDRRALQARRGHVTRDLMRELEKERQDWSAALAEDAERKARP